MEKGTSHKKQLSRLKKIEGQIRGLSKMIEEERYCIDIITQIKAIKSAIHSVELNVVDLHMKDCVDKAIASDNKKSQEKVLKEILSLLKATSR